MICDINKMSSKSKLFFRFIIIFIFTLLQLVLIACTSLEIISYLLFSLFQLVITTIYFLLGKLGSSFFTKNTWSYIGNVYIAVFVLLFSMNIFIGFINPTVYASDSIFSIENFLNENEVINYTEINDSRSDLFKEKTYSLQNADIKLGNGDKEYQIELSTNIYVFRMPFLSNLYLKTIISLKDANSFNSNNVITEQRDDSYFCYFKRDNIVYVIECNEEWFLKRIIKQVNQGTVL